MRKIEIVEPRYPCATCIVDGPMDQRDIQNAHLRADVYNLETTVIGWRIAAGVLLALLLAVLAINAFGGPHP